MLARRILPREFARWNHRWGAPEGRGRNIVRLVDRFGPSKRAAIDRLAVVRVARGPFSCQKNSSTRAFEYPWTYFQLARDHHSRLLEIGGALSGLQFVLSKRGYEVHNVDPFVDYGSGAYDLDPVIAHASMNRDFGTNVVLYPTTLFDADVPTHFDAAFCVSTIEHMSLEDIEKTLSKVAALLVPRGLLVLTVDLFYDLDPFTKSQRNRWGRNISIAWMQSVLGFDMVAGDRSELYGYEDFSIDRVRSHLGEYAVHMPHNQMAQLVSFRAPGLVTGRVREGETAGVEPAL